MEQFLHQVRIDFAELVVSLCFNFVVIARKICVIKHKQ